MSWGSAQLAGESKQVYVNTSKGSMNMKFIGGRTTRPFSSSEMKRCLVVSRGMERVRVVLVSPKNPQNIGSVLRIAGNMNVGQVTLVDPRCDPEDPAIPIVACNSPLLPDGLHVESTLSGALKDSMVSLCFSRRTGNGRRTLPSLAAFLDDERNTLYPQYLSDTQTLYETPVALVFGREESGLTEDEVNACSHCIEIPSNPSFPSLNLSHAVAVVVSELYQFCSSECTKSPVTESKIEPQATYEEVEALFQRVVHWLGTLDIDTAESRGGGDKGNHGRRKLAPGHLRSMLLRSKATQREVRSLFNLLKAIESSTGITGEMQSKEGRQSNGPYSPDILSSQRGTQRGTKSIQITNNE